MIKHRHFILNKPFGCLSQFVNNRNRKKQLLGDLYPFPKGTMAIGRLDAKSEGLLLLTTDGQLSEYIRTAKVEKEYLVQLDGVITNTAVEDLKQGVEISIFGKPYRTKSCEVKRISFPKTVSRSKKIRDERHGPTSWISVTLREGKFRQVRKMTAKVGFPTLRLIRTRIGNTFLGDMKAGEVREVEKLS